MVKSLFRQSFLFDALAQDEEVYPVKVELNSGAIVMALGRGLVEVIPAEMTENTKHILLSAGIHGNETAPMELLDSVLTDILNETVPVTEHCLFVLCHPEAAAKNVRYLDENLNRIFDDRLHKENTETRIAEKLKSMAQDFFEPAEPSLCWHLDMHTAIRSSKHKTFAVSPRVRKQTTRSRELISFLEKGEVEAILLANAPSNTFSWYSAEHFGAQALTMELGKVSPFGENDLTSLIPFETALKGLISNSLESLPEKQSIVTYRVTQTIKRMNKDFEFNFGDDIENFTTFEHGQVLGHDGEKLLFAKSDREAVVFPNENVTIGHRAALMVCKVEIRYEDDQMVYD